MGARCDALIGLLLFSATAQSAEFQTPVIDLELALENLEGGCEQDRSLHELIAHRLFRPQLYEATPKAPVGRLTAEFEPKGELHLVFVPDEHDALIKEVVAAASQSGSIVVHLLHPDDKNAVEKLLGVLAQEVTVSSSFPLESIWIRDFAPFWLEAGHGVVAIDPQYALACPDADAFGTHLARQRGVPAFRPPLYLDGGDLLTDGAGRCFTTTWLMERNGLDEPGLKHALGQFLQCRETIVLEPLVGEVVGHVDMFLHVAPNNNVLLGQAPPEDVENHAAMENNAAVLQRVSGLNVHRVAMPVNGLGTDGEAYLRSHLNLTVFNDVVLVPTFADAPGTTTLRAVERMYPDREVVGVASDTAAPYLGAVHCLTTTIPRIEP